MPYAAGLVAALTLAGCGVGAAEPAPPATTAVKSAPVSRSTTASSPPAATAGPNFPAGLPDAAKKQTDDGAKAFVEHFIAQVNSAWTKADPSHLDGLCLPTSKACEAWRRDAHDLHAKGQHYEGDPVSVVELSPIGSLNGSERVFAKLVQERRNIVDSAGVTVKTDSRKDLRLVALLTWGEPGWQVASFGTVNQ